MKSVLISIQPQHVENICTVVGEENGKPVYKKAIDVRKTRPKLETPFKCFIYCTQDKYNHLYDLRKVSKGEFNLSVVKHNKTSLVANGYLNGKVIGEFVCDRIDEISYDDAIRAAAFWEDFTYWNDCELDSACLHPDDLAEYANGNNVYGWHISDLKIYDKPKELGDFRQSKCPIPENRREKNLHCDCYCEYGFLNGCFHKGNYLVKEVTRPPQSWCYIESSKN